MFKLEFLRLKFEFLRLKLEFLRLKARTRSLPVMTSYQASEIAWSTYKQKDDSVKKRLKMSQDHFTFYPTVGFLPKFK